MLSAAESTSLSRSVLRALAPVRRSPQTQRRQKGEEGGEENELTDGSSVRGYTAFETSFITLFGKKSMNGFLFQTLKEMLLALC